MMTRLSPVAIAPGKSLPFDVFAEDGELLLLRGQAVLSQQQANTLRQHGRRHALPPLVRSPFSGMGGLAQRLSAIEKDILDGDLAVNMKARLIALVDDVIAVAEYDPDAAFACIHLEFLHSYLVVHQLMAALVAHRLGLMAGLGPRQRFSLVAAALTHDFGMLALQQALTGSGDLNPAQREALHDHPEGSVRLLDTFGITDHTWLDAVRNHHEALDGSGYRGEASATLSLSSRILAIADAFSAMLRPRPYRERVYANDALALLHGDRRGRYDHHLIDQLITDIGHFPPGSVVRLACNEIAVVVRNPPGPRRQSRLASLSDASGRWRGQPLLRDGREPRFAIVHSLDPAFAARSARLIEPFWNDSAG